MSKFEAKLKNWSTAYARVASLNQNQQVAVNSLAILLLVMATLQLASFSDFKDTLSMLGVRAGTNGWAVVVVIAEIWGGIGLVSLRMSGMIRVVGRLFAGFASGFWFVTTIQIVSGTDMSLNNSAFFGKYLTQTPGWWTVIEATVLMAWTIYALEVTKQK